jgi:nucleoside-diphosphate-sugar epimerase
LKALFPDYASQLTTILVENHEIATAYDEVVQGVDAVIHMASPLPPSKPHVDNEKEILIPARDGAVNMLKSASKSSSVRRVVLTSSSAAVVDPKVPRNEP